MVLAATATTSSVELVVTMVGVSDERLAESPRPSRSSMTPVSQGESEQLVARCRAGDRAAFRELFARHRSDVVRLVYRMLGSRTDVDDVVQEVFLQVHKSLRDFRGDAKFSTWLHRVTVNVVLMVRRAARSRPVFAGELPEEAASEDHLWPDEDASRRERLRAFSRCVNQLAEKKRTVFILHELEGMPAAEIAEVVAAPVLTVRTRLFYARKELVDLMKVEPTLSAYAATLEKGDERAAPARQGERAQALPTAGSSKTEAKQPS
jgi:RNA polymerase sigma-70 factor, ECF subfamily